MRKHPLTALLLAAFVCQGAAAQTAAPRPAWPSLQRQLAADRVAADTPLARLIRENQDFSLLRPEEARDRLAVPLWLRVWWRKAHPEGVYSAADATGGYPLVLKEVHEWMVTHPDLKGERLGSLQAQSTDKRKPKPRPVVSVAAGPDLSISGDHPAPRSESDIRINFWNTDQIVSSSNDIEGSAALAVYFSGDGGATWRQTFLPKQPGDSFQSDPAVEWTSDGTAWATALGVDSGAHTLRGQAYRSADGGRTWTFDGLFSGDQTSVDKQMTWVDHADGSPHKDNLYVIYHNGRQVYVNRRTPDGGWGEPLQVSGGETTGTGIGSDIKANRTGTVFAFWPDTGSQKIFMARSGDGGASFSRPASIARTFAAFAMGIPAQNRRGVLIYVTGGAFYRTAKKNMVYAAWTDLNGIRGCTTEGDPPNGNRSSPCTSRIWFTRSTNGGNTWSRPEMINNQKDLNDQFNPWLAVDEATGNLVMIYYDSFGEERPHANVWAQASLDDGATWSAAYKVTTEPSNENDGLPNGNQYGDYNGLSGYAGLFFPSWTDRRGGFGTKEQVWSAPLQIEVKAASRFAVPLTPATACLFRPVFLDRATDWRQLVQPVCR